MDTSTQSKDDFDKIFTEWTFNDKAGNLIKVVPWSLMKSEEALNIVGDIYAEVKQNVPSADIAKFFFEHTDLVFKNHIGKLNKLLCLTVDKPRDWLDNIDIAMGLEVLEVIWRQNFTGDRVQEQFRKWFVMVPVKENPTESLDSLLPGGI